MMEIEDFTYDFTNIVKLNIPIVDDEYLDKFVKRYIYLHQFSEEVDMTIDEVLKLFETTLEENEYVAVNDNKFLFLIRNDTDIDDAIEMIQFIFKTLAYNIEIVKNEEIGDKIFLLIKIEHY